MMVIGTLKTRGSSSAFIQSDYRIYLNQALNYKSKTINYTMKYLYL